MTDEKVKDEEEKEEGEGGRYNYSTKIPKSAFPEEWKAEETTEGLGKLKEIYPEQKLDLPTTTEMYDKGGIITSSVYLNKWAQRLMYRLQTDEKAITLDEGKKIMVLLREATIAIRQVFAILEEDK